MGGKIFLAKKLEHIEALILKCVPMSKKQWWCSPAFPDTSHLISFLRLTLLLCCLVNVALYMWRQSGLSFQSQPLWVAGSFLFVCFIVFFFCQRQNLNLPRDISIIISIFLCQDVRMFLITRWTSEMVTDTQTAFNKRPPSSIPALHAFPGHSPRHWS